MAPEQNLELTLYIAAAMGTAIAAAAMEWRRRRRTRNSHPDKRSGPHRKAGRDRSRDR
jgi:hypothetical protein